VASTEITIVSDGPEVYCLFADASTPDSLSDVYMWRESIPSEATIQWREGRNSTFLHAVNPKEALAWFLSNGWQACFEEQDFIDGKGWPT
jgi:hypothetical protein